MDTVVEVTVFVDLQPKGRQDVLVRQQVLREAQLAVDWYYNQPNLRLRNGDLLRFRIQPKSADDPLHHAVTIDADHEIDHLHWRPGMPSVTYAHEFGHMIGQPEEYAENQPKPDNNAKDNNAKDKNVEDKPKRLDISGTVMGRHTEIGPDGKPRLITDIKVPQRFVDVLARNLGIDDLTPTGHDTPLRQDNIVTPELPEGTPLPKAPPLPPEHSGTTTSGGLPSAAEIVAKLPGYMRKSRGLGLAEQKGDVRGPARDLEAQLRKLAPRVKTWHGADLMAQFPTKWIRGTQMDGGLPLRIRGDDKYYEVRVKSTFDWDALTVQAKGDYTLRGRSKDKRAFENRSGHERTGNIPVILQGPAVPGVNAAVSMSIPVSPTERASGGHRQELGNSSTVELCDPYEVDVPLTMEFTLIGPDGQFVPGRTTADGHVLLSVPTTLPTQDIAGEGVLSVEHARAKGLRHGALPENLEPVTTRPKRFVTEEVIVNRGTAPTFLDQVVAMLGPKYRRVTAIGTNGRESIFDFVCELGIKANLPKMTVLADADPEEGWVRSQPLFKGKNRDGFELFPKSTQLEMRAVARWVRVVDTLNKVPTTDRSHDHYESVHRSEVSRNVEAEGFVLGGGPGIAQAGVGQGGPTFQAGRLQNASTAVGQSTAVKHAVEVTGDVVRYEMVYDIQVRQLGGKPRTLLGNVSAYQLTEMRHARRAGLPGVPADDTFVSGPDRTKQGPFEFESGQALLGMVDEFDSGDLVHRTIQPHLTRLAKEKGWLLDRTKFSRQLTNRKLPLSYFGEEAFDGGNLTAKVAEALELGQNLADVLSDQQLSHLVKAMVGAELHIPLKKAGWFHERDFTLVLTADTGSWEQGELLSAEEITGLFKSKDATTAADGRNREITGGFGIQGRGLGALPAAGPSTALFGLGLAEIRTVWTRLAESARTHTSRRNLEVSSGDTVAQGGELGKHNVRQFRTQVTVTSEIRAQERHNRAFRKITIGRSGRQAPPTVTLGPPAPVTAELRMLVPEVLLTDGGPDPAAAKPVPKPNRPLGPATLKLPHSMKPATSPTFDNVEVEAFTGAAAVQESALSMLNLASGRDPVVRDKNGTISQTINNQLSATKFASDPSVFNRTTILDSSTLKHERRAADLVATIGVTYQPVRLSARQVTAKEFQERAKSLEGSIESSGGGGTSNRLLGFAAAVPVLTQQDYTSAPGGTNETGARAVNVIIANLFDRTESNTVVDRVKSGEKLKVGTLPQKMILARIDIEATVVAEAQHKGNLSFGLAEPDPAQVFGEVVDLPESALVWLTEDQFHELNTGIAPTHAPPTVTEDRGIEVPPSLRQGASSKPSMGLGGIIDPIDLRDVVDNLRVRLAAELGLALADRLLPDSTLDPKNPNIARIKALLSDPNNTVNMLINGGVVHAVRLEDRMSGRTYELTMEARFTESPERGVVKLLNKLKATVYAELGTTTIKKRSRSLFGLRAIIRPMLVGQEQPGPATSDGQAKGSVGGGFFLAKTWGIRDRTKTFMESSKYLHSAWVQGPVAAHRGKLAVTVGIRRHGTTYAEITKTQPVEISRIADEAFPKPKADDKFGATTFPAPDRFAKFTRNDLKEWRKGSDDGTTPTLTLPELGNYWTEHFFGDVEEFRSRAEFVLRDSGVKITPAIRRQLADEITVAKLRAAVSAAVDGKFKLPLPKSVGRELEIHLRLPGTARFASASASPRIRSYRDYVLSERVVTKEGGESHIIPALPVGLGGESPTPGKPDASGELRREFNIFDGPASEKKVSTRFAGPPRLFEPQMPWAQIPDDKLTRVLLADADFRIVAKRTKSFLHSEKLSYQDIKVSDAFAFRMRDADAVAMTGKSLPTALVEATKALADAGARWFAAERHRLGAQVHRESVERPVDAATRTQEKWLAEYDSLPARIEEQTARVTKYRAAFEAALSRAATVQKLGVGAQRKQARAALQRKRDVFAQAKRRQSGLVDRLDNLERLLTDNRDSVQQLRDYAAALQQEKQAENDLRAAQDTWWQAKRTHDREVAALHAQEELERTATESTPSPVTAEPSVDLSRTLVNRGGEPIGFAPAAQDPGAPRQHQPKRVPRKGVRVRSLASRGGRQAGAVFQPAPRPSRKGKERAAEYTMPEEQNAVPGPSGASSTLDSPPPGPQAHAESSAGGALRELAERLLTEVRTSPAGDSGQDVEDRTDLESVSSTSTAAESTAPEDLSPAESRTRLAEDAEGVLFPDELVEFGGRPDAEPVRPRPRRRTEERPVGGLPGSVAEGGPGSRLDVESGGVAGSPEDPWAFVDTGVDERLVGALRPRPRRTGRDRVDEGVVVDSSSSGVVFEHTGDAAFGGDGLDQELVDWHGSLSPVGRERFNHLYWSMSRMERRLFFDGFSSFDAVGRAKLAGELDADGLRTLVPAWNEVVALADKYLADIPDRRDSVLAAGKDLVGNALRGGQEVLTEELPGMSYGDVVKLAALWHDTTQDSVIAQELMEEFVAEGHMLRVNGSTLLGTPGADFSAAIAPAPYLVDLLLAAVPPGTRFADPKSFVNLVRNGQQGDPLDLVIAFHQTFQGTPRMAVAMPEGSSLGRAYWESEIGHEPEFMGRGPSGLAEVARRVRAGGHGSSALVFGQPPYALPEEAWNVVNHDGEVFVVNPRTGVVAPAEGEVRWASYAVHAVVFGSGGQVIEGSRHPDIEDDASTQRDVSTSSTFGSE
ncbi:toxin glutamine deamidase domain-containing protein, partial [Actinokineospora alba]|uniref:toxin glutamine deamidase domain-containing protein n=2 Tax=Actinokineospora alba TaxID=504798 RepID=UPI0011601222